MHTPRLLVMALCLVSCASEIESTSSDVREIKQEEALADFDQMVGHFRALYGATERKEQRYGFSFDSLVAEYRAKVAATTNEPAVRGYFQEFISRFKDAHISLEATVISDDSRGFSLPFSVMPVEDTFVVYIVGEGATGISRGDELISIDGVPAMQFAESVLKYVSMPLRKSAMHEAAMMLTGRASYLSSTLGANATIKLRTAAGKENTVTLPWKESTHLFKPRPPVKDNGAIQAISIRAAHVTDMEMDKFGARVPFFMTTEVKASLGITSEVKPSAQALAAVQMTAEEAAAVNLFAVKYTTNGKRVLLVRLPDYQPDDLNAAYSYFLALLKTFEASTDALVLDQTHNPGGALVYAEAIMSLLARDRFNGPVQAQNADRKWLTAYARTTQAMRQAKPNDPMADLNEEYGRLVDDAYSGNQPLSVPVPFPGDTPTQESDPNHWKKGVLILADELSVSCADLVPLLAQANGIAKVFGETTMGGGGTVQEVGVLSNLNMTLSISRGLNTVYDPSGIYPEARFIEDNGVTPDIQYAHTLADFRKGYVDYVKAFNAALP